MSTFGLRDIPIQNNNDESLGLDKYAVALSEFIQQCETPLTIALQGDWGSGKTSLMNLIKQNLEERTSKNNIHTVWFNTWQYSQFDMQDELAISMLSHFVECIAGDEDKKKIKKALLGLSMKLGKVVSSGVGNWLGGEGLSKGIENIFEKFSDIDPPKQIMNIKKVLSHSEWVGIR